MMECDENIDSGAVNVSLNEDGCSAVNSTILNYYKKFGRKRDLEQYFSLSTAQSEIRDPTSLFWRRMKAHSDSSDSGEKKSESSTEICRISIKCNLPDTDPSSSQDEELKPKETSDSPPIITEDIPLDISKQTDDEFVKSDDNHSQKSIDATLDLSLNKPHSPTSSVTSQRKLEWDSLADVGYGNETDRKTSASSLSTLERLALKQQYSNNDTQDPVIGLPTAQSTPQDDNDGKPKVKKGTGKTTKFYRREVDCVEVNMPHSIDVNPPQAINVNLTKHISFNVEKDGGVNIENIRKDVTVKPETISVETNITPQVRLDKEIQTSLVKSKDKSSSSVDLPKAVQLYGQGIPVLINLNTLRKRNRKKKIKIVRKKLRNRRNLNSNKENLPEQEKGGEQVSEAESFEYMPGHMYNQKQMNTEPSKASNPVDNKSSLESSGVLTTDSSKASKHSFTKDLDKSISLLKRALQTRYDDSTIKHKLIKEVVKKLLKSNYRDDETSTDFLSGLSFSSKKLNLNSVNQTTTSTSDSNNSGERSKASRPKKSILRSDKFNSGPVASTSQSAPNLPSVSNSENPIKTNLKSSCISSNTESDASSKDKNSSDAAFAKTSSEDFFQKYVDALRREEAYKKHLKDKELFLKQKLVCTDTNINIPVKMDTKSQIKLKELVKDLTRNNYDDGSGDASKLEGGSNSSLNIRKHIGIRDHRSHSVFTLASNSDNQAKKSSLKKSELRDSNYVDVNTAVNSRNAKINIADSSVQVNIREGNMENTNQCSKNVTRVVSDNNGEVKYLCVCNAQSTSHSETDKVLIYKCSRLDNKGIQSQEIQSNDTYIRHTSDCIAHHKRILKESRCFKIDECSRETDKATRSSQTNLAINLGHKHSDMSLFSSLSSDRKLQNTCCQGQPDKTNNYVHEAMRCVQTEISINPNIPDPSLSDINIMSNADCVTLIGERYRPKYRSYINEQPINTGSEYSYESTSGEGPPNHRKYAKNLSGKVQKDSNELENSFKIPIQGTNMTLMVNIGSKPGKGNVEFRNAQVSKSVETELVNTAEQACLVEQCSKDVQSLKTNIFKQMDLQNRPQIINTVFTREGFFSNLQENVSVFDSKATKNSLEAPCDNHTNVENDCLPTKCNCSLKCNDACGPQSLFRNQPPSTGNTKKQCECGCFKEYKFSCIDVGTDIAVTPNVETIDLMNCPHAVQTPEPLPPISIPKAATIPKSAVTLPMPVEERPHKTFPDPTISCKPISREASPKISPRILPTLSRNSETSPTRNTLRTPRSPILVKPAPKQACCSDMPSKSKSPRSKETSPVKRNVNKTKNDIEKIKCCLVEQSKKEIYNTDTHNTFPKAFRDKPKPFIRSNTDPSKYDACNYCQTDNIDVANVNTQVIKEPNYSSDDVLTAGTSSEENKHPGDVVHDPILEMIQGITKRYTKKDLVKNQRKKCFKEIMTILNYLLDTEDNPSTEQIKALISSTSPNSTTECSSKSRECESSCLNNNTGSSTCNSSGGNVPLAKCECQSSKSDRDQKEETTVHQCTFKSPVIKSCNCDKKIYVDKAVQLSKNKNVRTVFSDLPCSTDMPCTTSSDSGTCGVLNKIKQECEKYHQKKCMKQIGKKCEGSSSTSVHCPHCKQVHHCHCRWHRCRANKAKIGVEKSKKKCVAYNLIIQTSESMMSGETISGVGCQPLQNVVFKVPPKLSCANVPFKEMAAKIEARQTCRSPSFQPRCQRSRSVPNESETSSIDPCTVRHYLERNRPDFIERSTDRQHCLKKISEIRANERAAHRELLSLQLLQMESAPKLNSLSESDLRRLARELGVDLTRKKVEPKFTSEREMKKHSEKIYKSLPEVRRKKEEAKKESVKRTNLLMANIFKKNLQKKTLKGAVNLSNYSTVVKI